MAADRDSLAHLAVSAQGAELQAVLVELAEAMGAFQATLLAQGFSKPFAQGCVADWLLAWLYPAGVGVDNTEAWD